MATTTAFGWETPDDTDLLKDGAAAIRTLGSSIDTSMSELKGGTTGQVLSKTSNTDMDFTWVGFVGCSLENGSSQSIDNNTDTMATFDTELYDTDAMHSTSSNTSRITIPTGKGGYYEFRWAATWASSVLGNRRIRLVKNGSTNYQGVGLTTAGVGLTSMAASAVVSAAPADYFELQVFQDSGGALVVGTAGIISFQASKVG
jgi:hypothetical protein